MGHERIGLLPKTRNWRRIVEDLATPALSEDQVGNIASNTLDNVRERYSQTRFDGGVRAAFQFLIYLSVLSKSPDPQAEFNELGIVLPTNISPIALTRIVHDWVEENQESLEYAHIARSAAGDAIASWHSSQIPKQATLFDLPDEPFAVWQKASNGSGFCELSRLFFAKFTERYLKYFLEREASAAVPNLNEREILQRNIESHINNISQHAFETSKITQSFAAGWFNKNTKSGLPPNEAIDGFLAYAFEKMREELLREKRPS